MADSVVPVTAGTGTNIDTRTEGTNGNHRQVVVLGDPATNAGVAPVDATEGLMVRLGATDNAVLDTIDTNTDNIPSALAGEYETVAASQTDQALGATGGTGDYLASLLIVPATTSPGVVSIKDGGGSAITVFTGGASSVSNLVPFTVALGIYSAAGAWQVTTGANVSVVAAGNFT